MLEAVEASTQSPAPKDDDPVAVTIDGAVATVWLNRPHAHNTIDLRTSRALKAAAFDLEADPQIRVVVLRGRGRQFSAGGDMSMFQGHADTIGRYIKDVIGDFHEALVTLRRMPKATVAVVHGACAGGGLSLSLACDFVLAEERTKFAVAYRKIGAATDGGMTHLLSRLVGQRRAVELLLLSDGFTAAQALEWGLVNRVVPEQGLEDELARISEALAANAPTSVGALKGLVYGAPHASFEEQLSRELAAFSRCADTADFREGVAAFSERRAPRFQGR